MNISLGNIGTNCLLTLKAFDWAKADVNTWGQVLDFTSNCMDLVQKATKVTNLNTTIRTFGLTGAVLSTFQLGNAVDYLGKLALSCGDDKCQKEPSLRKLYESFDLSRIGAKSSDENHSIFDKDQTRSNALREIGFGAANFCVAILWLENHNIINLGILAFSVGGVAVGTAVITTGAIIGLLACSYEAHQDLQDDYIDLTDKEIDQLVDKGNGALEKKIENREFSKNCIIAWSITEIALIALPMTVFAPAAPIMIAGNMFAKAAGIASFIYSKK